MKVINRVRAEQEGMGWGDDATSWVHYVCSADKAAFTDIMALEGAPITKDHAIQYDGTCYYKGYDRDSARIWQVGSITGEIRRGYDTIFTAEDATEAMLNAGVKANEVYEAMYKVVREPLTKTSIWEDTVRVWMVTSRHPLMPGMSSLLRKEGCSLSNHGS